MLRRVAIEVAPHEAGMRLDRLLVLHVEGLGRKRARELFERGLVRIGKRRVSAGQQAQAGDQLECELEDEAAEADDSVKLDVRLETPELVVVDKPAGLASVPLAPGERGTVASGLVARYPEMSGVGYRPREPGLVHRLDTQTSGLLLAARRQSSFERLRSALQTGALHKRYLALAEDHGLSDAGVIDKPIGPDPRRPERVLVHEAQPANSYARAARTTYRVLERRAGLLLIELEAPHAMRHQIRAHLASLGHPIIGDVVYGRGLHPALGQRHALHASYIAWAGDGTLPSFAVRSELPDDLAVLLP